MDKDSGKKNIDNVSRETLIGVLLAQGFAILPLFLQLALWLPLIWILVVIWRIQIHRGAWSFPSFRIKLLLGIASTCGLFISYAGSISIEPMVAFLVVSFSLKLIEVRSRNDVLMTLVVGYFTIAAQFLFFQGIFSAIYGLFSSLIILAAWLSIFRKRNMSFFAQISSASAVLLQSIPIMLVLFLVIPRINPLWHISMPQKNGVTGFSDSMTPGDLSNLAKSQGTAFRVIFSEDEIPPPNKRYWRGLVLDDFDGRKWASRELNQFSGYLVSGNRPHPKWSLEILPEAGHHEYQVLIEPHQQRWLFTLAAPISIESNLSKVGFAKNLLGVSRYPINSRTQYSAVSVKGYQYSPDSLTIEQSRRLTRLPINFNPQSRSLVQSWISAGDDTEQIIERALNLYNRSFTYTLQPPLLGTHTVDEFLFSTQRGFCEHFASSFVVLMRNAGIPARVVVGYQGGQYIRENNYLLVKQADAHAWAEVWIQGEGWRRVDPTARVAPERIEMGLDQAVNELEFELIEGEFFRAGNMNWLAQGRMYMELLEFQWAKMVLGYDSELQSQFLKKILGSTDPMRIAFFLIGVCFIFFITYLFILTFNFSRKSHGLTQRLLFKVIRRLAKHGYFIRRGESPKSFLERVSEENPSWRKKLTEISRLYYLVAYSENEKYLPLLKEHVKNFKNL